MEIVNYPNTQFHQVGATGDCPHCNVRSLFQPVTQGHSEHWPDQRWHIITGAQCQSCKQFVLVQGIGPAPHGQPWQLVAVYPLGKPSDVVAPEVPPLIASDFKEALRCNWIEAFKATVAMCRRALQSSCVELKAKDATLVEQIDDLAAKGIITEPLRQIVRLTGNEGAHPGKDGLNDVAEQDANEIIEFTKEFFHHVFVVPAKLRARKAPPAATPANP
jgi:hypothetical protein